MHNSARPQIHVQLTYLDLYLIHFPSSMPGPTIRPDLRGTWRAMEDLVDKVSGNHVQFNHEIALSKYES